VLRLILAFVEIAFHRRGPDALPASRFLVGVLLVVYLLVAFGALRASADVAHPIALLASDTAFYFVFVWSVLKAFDRERRFKQTWSALLGTDTLLNVLSVPLLVLSQSLKTAHADTSVPDILSVLLWAWSIDISGFIVSRALDRTYLLGVAIMLGYVLLSISLRVSLFPMTK
jgi:hypothetical protein